MRDLNRRAVLGAASLFVPGLAWAEGEPPWRRIDALEKISGARIGVMAIDTGNGKAVFYRENERFLMCSSFKLSLAALVLARGDKGQEKLDRLVRYQKSDLMDYAPVTTANLASGLTVAKLCEAAVTLSDNTAANLLLASVGGPAALTAFWRDLGDKTSRLDRMELALNTADGDKDTTTPVATAGNLKEILTGSVLTLASRARLLAWLSASTTGLARLRAGLPKTWGVGDKTGSGPDTLVDLAIGFPPGRKPILIAAYVQSAKGGEPLFPQLGQIIAKELG